MSHEQFAKEDLAAAIVHLQKENPHMANQEYYHDPKKSMTVRSFLEGVMHGRARDIESLETLARIHLETGSSDEYGRGIYNGLLTAISILSNSNNRAVTLKRFREMKQGATAQIITPRTGKMP